MSSIIPESRTALLLQGGPLAKTPDPVESIFVVIFVLCYKRIIALTARFAMAYSNCYNPRDGSDFFPFRVPAWLC
jgi:hypothetical protein